MFDVLTYEKGASVLRMLEQYLGAEEFRKGIALYLRKHQFANTETGDLWDALSESSHQPVRTVMDSWIFQPGFPIVHVGHSADGRGMKFKQRRFLYLDAGDRPQAQSWHVPVMVRCEDRERGLSRKLLLTEKEATLDLAAKCNGRSSTKAGAALPCALRARDAGRADRESCRAQAGRALRRW